ncbi:MAG: ATP-binding cassette domain-containing protein [candidate division NC10 bacterium]|nr:ATP-binding cassette domain-containing protein [candidate division NC10 bacterium]
MDTTPAIAAADLTKKFGAATAVDGLTLSVAPGEIFGLVGPDGAGKTTAIRLLTGVMRPTAGTARVLGVDVARHPEVIRPRIGYVPQSSSLYADLSVRETLQFQADLFGLPRAERERRMAELLAFSRLEVFATRLAKNLSGGMRQKLALCAALIHRPEILFLDEPTIGVDPVSRRDFWLLIYQLLQQGLTLLVSTPYLDEAERCHRVGLMDHGRLIACNNPDGLRRLLPGTLLEMRGPAPEAAALCLRRLPEVRDAQVFGDVVHLVVADAERALPRVVAALRAGGLPEAHLRPILPSLEDVFVTLLRGQSRGTLSQR